MPRPSLAVPLAALACAAACTKLAELAGALDRSAASISVHIAKDSLSVGDTLQIRADVNSKDGRPAWTDTTVTWQSSNPAVVAIDASNPPPGPHNFARLIATNEYRLAKSQAQNGPYFSAYVVNTMSALGLSGVPSYSSA